jgi:H+/Cl- antiporter ClcA
MLQQRERGQQMFRSWWQQIRIHPVASVFIALLTAVFVLIVLLGYIFNWSWTGLGSYSYIPPTTTSNLQRGKTFWDWLQLLIIPVVLAVGGYVINLTISRSER